MKSNPESNQTKPLMTVYDDNWDSCKEMFVSAWTRQIPDYGDDTTNQAESMFSKIKRDIKKFFKKPPSLRYAIPLIIKVIDRRYLQRISKTVNKSYKISHDIPIVQNALESASYHLTELGMNLFYSALQEMITRESRLTLIIDDENQQDTKIRNSNGLPVIGVQESYKSGFHQIYNTTFDNCNCKRSIKKSICIHMLALRHALDEPLFSTSMFLRDNLLKHSKTYQLVFNDIPTEGIQEPSESDKYQYDKDTPILKINKKLTEHQKFRLISEETRVINDNISNCDEKTFQQSLKCIQIIRLLSASNKLTPEVYDLLSNQMKNCQSLFLPQAKIELLCQINWYRGQNGQPPVYELGTPDMETLEQQVIMIKVYIHLQCYNFC